MAFGTGAFGKGSSDKPKTNVTTEPFVISGAKGIVPDRYVCIFDSKTTANGSFSFESPTLVDGHIEGEIVGRAPLTFGENSRVKANVHGTSVVVMGRLEGNIDASERICLSKTARVVGSIRAPSVGIEEGAKFEGRIDMPVQQVVTQTATITSANRG